MYYQTPDKIFQLEKRMAQLEEENKEIKEKLVSMKPVHIEAINYKIQELVVKELKGTLNIGMTGITDPQQLAEWINASSDKEEEMEQVTMANMEVQDNKGRKQGSNKENSSDEE